MKNRKKIIFYSIISQVFVAIAVLLLINSFVTSSLAQTQQDTSSSNAGIYAISAALAIAGSTIGAAIAIKSVGTAAISSLVENEATFFKAFLVIALGEALAIYGLIVSILLWIKIP